MMIWENVVKVEIFYSIAMTFLQIASLAYCNTIIMLQQLHVLTKSRYCSTPCA